MKLFTKVLLLISLLFLLCSCAGTQWSYEKEAIRIRTKTDPQLNLYQGRPHTLLICVHQMKDPNGFKQALREPQGMQKLLDCAPFDPSITSSNRIVVYPGENTSQWIDRSEGARWIGIVLGYYNMKKRQSMRMYEIPLNIFRYPKTMKIDLELGPQQLLGPKEKE